MTSNPEALLARARALQFHGLLAPASEQWVTKLLRRRKNEHVAVLSVGSAPPCRPFQPLCYFDWNWSKRCNRAAVEAMMSLDFFKDATNAILVRPNEIGKPIFVKNIAHHALINGHTLLFPTAGELLRSLATLGSDSALRRRYESPRLLVIDEIGYPSYSNRHADLLFELVSRPMSKSSVVTTNRSFTGWRGAFPNAYRVSLVDALIDNA